MRVPGLVALFLIAACSTPGGASASPKQGTVNSTSAAAQRCSLPVWWIEPGARGQAAATHGGFISLPDGAFSDAGAVPPPAAMPAGLASYQFAPAAFIAPQRRWVRAGQNLISPDGTAYTYWTQDSGAAQIHLASTSTGTDRIVYSGQVLYAPIAYQPDGIYAVQVLSLRQAMYEKLYRLDPAGGVPQLVPGSDRQMYQYGWVLISDGAAWGIESRVAGSDYFYSVLRLDLATHQVSRWFEGPANEAFWPLGVDARHRLYAMFQSTALVRLDQPDHAVELQDPPKFQNGIVGGASAFALDLLGVSLTAVGGVWHYGEDPAPKRYLIGRPDAILWPAGRCL